MGTLWTRRDPLPRFQSYLAAKGLLTTQKIEALEAEAKAEIQAAVGRFEEQMKICTDPLHMFEHHYDELTPTLRAQREELTRELALESEQEAIHG